MKQFFEPPRPATVMLSLEEEAIIHSEIMTEENEAQTAITAITRAEAASTALEDVILIGETKEDALQANAGLIDAVAEMGVAGSVTDPQSLIPSDYVSMESIQGIKDTLKKIWDSIVQMLKTLWENIQSAFGKYSLLLKSYQDRLDGYRTELKKIVNSATSVSEDVTIPLKYAGCARRTDPSNGDHVLENWDIMSKATNDVLINGARNDLFIGKWTTIVIEKAISAVKLDNGTLVSRALDKAIEEFLGNMRNTSVGGTKSNLYKVADKGIRSTPYDEFGLTDVLPSGKQLVLVMQNDKQNSDSTHLHLLEMYLATHVTVKEEKPVETFRKEVNIKLPKPDVLLRIIDEMDDVLEAAIDYAGSSKTVLTNQRKSIEKASNTLVQAAGSLNDSNSHIQRKVQILLRLNKHYGAMISATGGSMLGIVKDQVNASGSFLKKCIDAYGKAEVKPAK